MIWSRTLIATLVGGVVMWLASFVLHGMIMGATYTKYPQVFSQEATNPLLFLVVEILIAFPAAVIFTKTRGSWSAGIVGGLTFGFWLGLVGSFAQFFSPLVIEGFPY
jgi:site-specific recombinase